MRVLPEEVTGQRLYNMTAIDLGALKAGDKGAETRRKLLDLGIAGNRYRDQGSRSGIGLGTHNYAVFDDELLNIKDRYAEGGPVVPGNIDLHNRPVVRNSDDSISTVLSITVGFGDKTYVLPRVVGGKVVSNQEAIDHFRQTGEHLGAYDKQKDAEDYSQRLHEEQAKEYKDKARGGLVKKYAEGGRASTALDAAFAKRKARANALAEATVRNIPDLAKQGPGAVADALKDAYGLGERYLRSRTPGGVVADVAGGARALRDATTRYATDRAQNPMKVLADAYGVGKDIVTAVPQAVEDVAKLSERAQALKASDPEAARRLQASIAMAALGVVPGVRKGKQAVKAAEQAVKAAERAPQAIQLGRREMHPGTKGFIEDYRNATSENPLDASSAVHGDYAVTELSPSSRGIHLSDIRSLQPGAGGGTRALKELKALADKHNVPITGTAVAYHRDPKYIGSSTELRDWYKKHGFEDLGGDAREGYDIQYYPAAQQAAEKVAAKYLDPESTRIADWQWRPQEDVKAELGLTEVPPHVVDYGRFMDEQAMRAAKGQMTPRDLLKAYGITRSSMQRKARSLKTAQKYGLELEQLGLEKVRPEGAFSELLGTPEGQAYLDAAQRGQVDDRAIADMMAKFRPYGFQNALGRDLEWGARNLPQRSSEVADMVAAAREGASAPEDWTRFVKDKVTGVDAAKAGFVGAMLGRGDLPTFDARQIILQTGQPTKKATKYLSRKKGEGSVEAVRRLTARMEDLNLALPPELEPYRQHLTHHTVWDKASNEMTTHEDVRNALKNYAGGGLVKKYGV